MWTKICCVRLEVVGTLIAVCEFIGSLVGVEIYSSFLQHVFHEDSLHNENKPAAFIFILTICVINLFTSSLLIFGTVMKRYMFMLPWLTGAIVIPIVAIFYFALDYTEILFDVPTQHAIAISCILLAARSFLWYVIYSHYKLLKAAYMVKQEQLVIPTTVTSQPPNKYELE